MGLNKKRHKDKFKLIQPHQRLSTLFFVLWFALVFFSIFVKLLKPVSVL